MFSGSLERGWWHEMGQDERETLAVVCNRGM